MTYLTELPHMDLKPLNYYKKNRSYVMSGDYYLDNRNGKLLKQLYDQEPYHWRYIEDGEIVDIRCSMKDKHPYYAPVEEVIDYIRRTQQY